MEVLEQVLQQLHSDTGSVYVGQLPVEIFSDAFMHILSAARLSWANYIRQNMFSKVHNIFSHQIMVTMTCKQCNLTKNIFYNGQNHLTVAFEDDPSKGKKTVSDLIHDEILGGMRSSNKTSQKVCILTVSFFSKF